MQESKYALSVSEIESINLIAEERAFMCGFSDAKVGVISCPFSEHSLKLAYRAGHNEYVALHADE